MLIFRTHWGTLLLRIQLLPSGPSSLNLIGKVYMMIRIVDGQKVLLHQNLSQKVMEDRQLKVQETDEAVGMLLE